MQPHRRRYQAEGKGSCRAGSCKLSSGLAWPRLALPAPSVPGLARAGPKPAAHCRPMPEAAGPLHRCRILRTRVLRSWARAASARAALGLVVSCLLHWQGGEPTEGPARTHEREAPQYYGSGPCNPHMQGLGQSGSGEWQPGLSHRLQAQPLQVASPAAETE